MDNDLAMSILFDPEGFWPQAFHSEARKQIQSNGTKEQKAALGKETVAKGTIRGRLSEPNNFNNRRMGTSL